MSTGKATVHDIVPLKETTDRPGARPLRECAAEAINDYFQRLDGQPATDVYAMVLSEVEAPLLEAVMAYTGHNQTRAADVLGLNRGTLRKKLKQYGLL